MSRRPSGDAGPEVLRLSLCGGRVLACPSRSSEAHPGLTIESALSMRVDGLWVEEGVQGSTFAISGCFATLLDCELMADVGACGPFHHASLTLAWSPSSPSAPSGRWRRRDRRR